MNVVFKPLCDDRLYLFVLGPGFGETTLVRIPPDTWIVIDSFRIGDRAAAERVLSHYEAKADFLLLTHPHQDHEPGFVQLIEHSEQAVVACLHPQDPDVLLGAPDDPLQTFGNDARRVFDRVVQAWREVPGRYWRPTRGKVWEFPRGTLTSLHPNVPIEPYQWSRTNMNDLSSAALLRWEKVSLLLGADVTNAHAGWEDICTFFNDLGNHTALKVPHHGSREALYDGFGSGDMTRCWIVTPYSKCNKLPRFEDGQGIDHALGFVGELLLTSLPGRLVGMPNMTGQVKRTDLQGEYEIPGSTLTVNEKLNRCVVIGFAPDGSIVERRYGDGTLQVTNE